MELRWDAVTIDCRDPAELAVFWCGLLGVEVRGSFGPSTALGAREVERREEEVGTWVVMADPEGNLFCLVAD